MVWSSEFQKIILKKSLLLELAGRRADGVGNVCFGRVLNLHGAVPILEGVNLHVPCVADSFDRVHQILQHDSYQRGEPEPNPELEKINLSASIILLPPISAELQAR